MNTGKSVLAQMQSLIPRFHFEKLAKEYNADKNVRTFSTWNLLQVMLLTHCTAKKSLRDICSTFTSVSHKYYHLGIGGISRNNLSNALAKRNADLFEKLFYMLAEKVSREIGFRKDKRFRFKNPLVVIDSTTISLCLSLCKWASFRSTKGGIKAHTMYNVKMQMPEVLILTEAKKHDHTAITSMTFREGTIYVFDKAYLCLKTLQNINKNGAFFVLRTKSNTQYRIIRKNKPVVKTIHLDCIISFTGAKSGNYPDALRLVRYKNPEDGRVFDYITNNLDLSASTIAAIYKARWDIELFFKWIKQNLKVKSFYGRSENAVRIQLWTAAIAFLLISYIRFLYKTIMSATEVIRILSANIFSDRKIIDLLGKPPCRKKRFMRQFDVQLDFGF